MTVETSEVQLARWLDEIDDPSFDEVAWTKMLLSSIPRITTIRHLNSENRRILLTALLRSPHASTEVLFANRFQVLISEWSGAALGKNPMVPIWMEVGDPHFSEFAHIPMRHTLDAWNDRHLRQSQEDRKKQFDKLIAFLLQPVWWNLLSPARGDSGIDGYYELKSFPSDLQDDFVLFFQEAKSASPERCLEIAKDGHRLLLALCKTFETPVPGNIFSSLEEP